MHYVIIRDDDTNALTPVEYLERLYRPFLDRGLPVNLAVIPNVATGTRMPDGRLEGYLTAGSQNELSAVSLDPNALHRGQGEDSANKDSVLRSHSIPFQVNGPPFSERERERCGEVKAHVQTKAIASSERSRQTAGNLPIATNRPLVSYLLENRGYHVAQHGYRHDYWEFDRLPTAEIGARLDQGTELLVEAGFRRPETFVAPYDKLSRGSLLEVARRFSVLSTGWFELRRLPVAWWPRYANKKFQTMPHWQIGHTRLLTHPGCLLSYMRPCSTMFENIIQHIHDQHLTVLVTHWWEYFRNGQPDGPLIEVLHQTGDYMATHPEIKVISFSELLDGSVSLN